MKDNLEKILEEHKKWLSGDKGIRADLSVANLRGANLRGANLRGANLSVADLREADLSVADLREADLREADLREADLSVADLSVADLSGADLSGANLSGADLSVADLSGANLSRANLSGANLRGANLRGANLRGANLSVADLREADLSVADLREANLSRANLNNVIYNENTAFLAMTCPEEGEFIGYKKCLEEKIVKLLIMEDAKRSSATSRKCRASKVKVLEITNIENTKKYKMARSQYDSDFIYKIGETIEVKDFDEDRWNECSVGIHFFITREEAVQYKY